MTDFVISRKTIAAALLALAAVLFSTAAKADYDLVYLASPIGGVKVNVSSDNYNTNLVTSIKSGSLYTAASVDFSPISYRTIKFDPVIPTGYTFKGWCKLTKSLSTQPTGASSFNLSTPITTNRVYEVLGLSTKIGYFNGGAINGQYAWGYALYLNLQPNRYTVSFDSLGGTACSSTTVTYDSTYQGKLPTPTRIGHLFHGWYTGKTTGTKVTEDTVVKILAPQTLYARWYVLSPTITLNAQGGTVEETSLSCKYDRTYTLPTPTRTGYIFEGWYTEKTGGTRIADSGTSTFTSDLTLYAHWTIIRTAISVGKSGTGSGTVTPSGSASYDYGTKLTLTATPATGSKFVKWSDGVTTSGRTITVGLSAKTYTAQFELKTFKVTFDAGGGTVTTASKTVTYSNKFGELPTPTWAGHTFIEWQTPGGTRITADSTVSLTADVQLVAKYTINSYTIQTIRNAASEGRGNTSGGGRYEYGSVITIEANAEDGSRFVMWNDGNTNASRTVTVTKDAVYSATFELVQYTVKFIYYNAAGQQVVRSQQVKHGKAATPPTMEEVDQYPKHVFIGWGNNQYETVRSAMEIYAQYDTYSYKIHYNPNCTKYTGTMLSQTLKVDEQRQLSLNTYVRAGYDFLGWTTTATSETVVYINGQMVEGLTDIRDATIELYAVWSANKYRVSFSDDGRTVEPAFKQVAFDEVYGDLPQPSRTGYTLLGWYTSASSGTKIESTTKVTITADQTLYAHWKANGYTVTFDKNGGNAPSTATKSVTYDSTYGTLARCTRTGYTLEGWYTAASGGTKIESSTKVAITSAQTLYAHWTANTYTVYFDRNGGDYLSEYSRTVTYDSEYGTLPTTTRRNHKFAGWTDKDGNLIGDETVVAIDDNHTLYAAWERETYTIRYDADDGVGAMDDQTANRGEETELTLNGFTKVGYLFKNWVLDAEGDKTYFEDGATVRDLAGADETAVLTAEWTNIVYTVAFDANWKLGEGILRSEVPEPQTGCAYDNTYNLSSWSPETDGMAEFLGWSADPDADEPEYPNEGEILNLTTEGGSTVTLYAVWKDTLSELSHAVGCDNANLVSYEESNPFYLARTWHPLESGKGIGSGEVTMYDKETEGSSRLNLTVSTNGTLVFVCKMTTPGAKGVFLINGNKDTTFTEVTESITIEREVTGAKGASFQWRGYGPADCFVIESLRWYPGDTREKLRQENPEPTEADAPVITSDFSFVTDEHFDYVILTTTDLKGPWEQYGEVITGNGQAVSLPMPGAAGEGTRRYEDSPARFFKVEVRQRNAQ